MTAQPNSSALNKAAKKRIDQYTQTAAVNYDLLYTELAIFLRNNKRIGFNDDDVHNVLLRSGIKRKIFDQANNANEWFETDLETVKHAIAAVKDGRQSLHASEISTDRSPIVLRPEQREAINKTLKQFKKGNQMLWNAKMRFGKTLSALQVVKEHVGFRRVLILTHRPDVEAGWFKEFKNIFYDTPDFAYGSRTNGEPYANLEARAKRGECRYLYFASIQDLRGSERVGGNFDKNNEVFATPWDLIIVDEAHEGTQTTLGKAVLQELVKPDTKVLRLSGTPFNLLDDFKEDEIYTWDYVMEQRAKKEWDLLHPGDHNPYAELPRLNIYTYDLGKLLPKFADEDIAFNFREFFRTKEDGAFVHEKDILAFLNLLTKEDAESQYPFANAAYRDIFRHTLWMLPGVKEAKALSAMLKAHPVFGYFDIVNVAGNGDDDEENGKALHMVEAAIGADPDETRTITLSCSRLTTGVSVKPWTGVLMLSGSYSTSASAYMQTIFRVQTPATINGRVKEECYVFDFAPDRTLKVLAETAKISTKAGKQGDSERQQLGDFLNFCPIISIEGSKMSHFNVDNMLQQLKKVYVERVVRNGFEDTSLYNDELMKLSDIEIAEFYDLKGIIGQTKAMKKSNDIDINRQGLNNEEYAEQQKLEAKKKKDLTDEEKARLEELKQKRKVKDDAISILRGISIRMPLLIYGADIADEDKELTIDNFTQLIDPQSWEEFMPRGVTKQHFNAFKKYYDPDIFAAAGKRIRQMARAADNLAIEERIERIAAIFATFRNPDKETVLTPWRVVNMHMSDCLGGYCFFNDDFSEPIAEPRPVTQGTVTEEVFAADSYLLEINSKSGLYPLYLAYSIYRTLLRNTKPVPESLKDHLALWDKAVAEHIFVICKTPMAKSITRRTLVGFRKATVNTRYFEDLVNQIKNKPDNFIAKVVKGKSFWKTNENDNMKFKAIVGNPPYQVMDQGNCTSSTAIYPLFIDIATKINPIYLSMITPSKWLTLQGRGLSESWALSIIESNNVVSIFDYSNSNDVFPNVEIKGGICYFLISPSYDGPCRYSIIQKDKTTSSTRFLNKWGIVIRDAKAEDILSKIAVKHGDDYFNKYSFASFVMPRHQYDQGDQLSTSWRGYSISPSVSNTIKCYLNKQLISDGYGWVNINDIPKNHKTITYHKIYISKAYGAGEGFPHQILGVPFYGEPNSVCTDTYIVIRPELGFDSQEAAINATKYIKSKFFRYLVSVKKKTQDAARDVYQFVPLQEFSSPSDIDWSKPISEIDAQLYAKYGLSPAEIAFIESMIKPME